jgi:hypothetical protein
MPVTWKRLYGPAQLTNAAATKYTCPALTKTRIRHIHVTNPTGSAVTFTMSIGADAAGTRIYDVFSIAAGDVLNDFGVYVVDAAEIVQAFASTTLVLNITIDGEEITLG